MNKLLKFNILILLFFIFSTSLNAQFYNFGQDPSAIRWSQIETQNFRFVFSSNDSVLAQKTVNDFENSFIPVSSGLHLKPRRTPIVLHTQSVISNGFVVWAPRRAELFTNYSQSTLSMDNMEQLAIHEFRHIVQMNKMHQGMGKVLYYILGEESVGALNGLFVPMWFLEGDAVCTETAFSLSGRGRLPGFNNKMKAQLLEKGKYTYDKAVYGSYKDFIPDRYELGYFITAQARKDFGKDIWSDVLNNVARKPYTIFPFSNGLKKTTGLRKTKLYNAVLDSLTKEWTQTNLHLKATYYSPISKKSKFYSNYETPFPINDSVIVAFKKNQNEEDKIVSINYKGDEKTVLKTGYISISSINQANKLISFIEYKNDMRWQNRSYSNIATYNCVTKKNKRLTKKSRYQTSVLSADATKIAAVYNTTENNTGLHIIDAENGQFIKEIKSEDNLFIIDPAWSADGRLITCILQNETGKALGIIDIENNKILNLTNFTYYELNFPRFYKHFILYTSNYNGIDNIFSFDTESKRIFQLTSSFYGASKGNVDIEKERIIYLNLTSNGNEIVYTPFDSLLWLPVNQIESYENTLYKDITLQETGIINFKSQADSVFTIKPYRKFNHLFNFHSWAPLYIDVDQSIVNPGVVLFSQNLLSTATSSIGYKYNPTEKTGRYIFGIEYSGFYPILTTNFEYGNRKYHVSNSENTVTTKETKLINGLRLPFTFTKGRFIRQMQLSVNSSMIFIDPMEKNYKESQIHSIDYGLYFYNYSKTIKKNIYPQWAQSLSLRYAHTPLSGENLGNYTGGSISLFFPGIIKHNSFFLTSSYQKREVGDYAFSFLYAMPRGFNELDDDFESILRISSNYALPLLHPDLSIGPLIYIKRLRTLMFYDYGITYNKKQILRSYGLDLVADVHILRFIAPIELGMRFIYRQNDKRMIFEPLFSVKFEEL